jgi:beta-lactam-binding protein with PASTA domain
VSKGPELVTVPDLRLLTLEAAQQRLVALGLETDTVGYLPGKLVTRMTPGPNEKVKKGTKVTLGF